MQLATNYTSPSLNGTHNWTLPWGQGLDDGTGPTGSGSDVILGWARDVLLGTVLGFMCLLTAVGNAMVLYAVRTEKTLQTVSNMYIVSLAVADLIVGITVMPISAIYIFTKDWVFGVIVCQFWISVDYTASTASILNLFILSLDRYWSVTSPLRYMRRRTKKRALLMITTVWFVSSLWLIPIIGWHYFEHGGVRTVPGDVCDTEYTRNTALKIVTGILNYYLPLAVMYALYTKIFLEIKTRSKMEVGQKISRASMKKNKEAISFSGHDDTNDDPGTDGFCSSSLTEKDRYIIQNKMVPDAFLLDKIPNHVDTDTDVLTAATEDELLTKTVKVVPRVSVIGNDGVETSPEQESRFWYNYDEVVLDPTTEKVQRYFYEEKETLLCENGLSKDTDSQQTTLIDLQSITDCLQKDIRVQIDIPDTQDKARLTFPKENHPVKNHHVNNRVVVKARLKVENNVKNSTSKENLKTPSRTNSTKSSCSTRSTNIQRPNGNHTKRQQNNHKRPQKQLSSSSTTNGHIMSTDSFNAFKKLKVTIKPRTFTKKKRKMNSSLTKEIKAIRQLGVIMGAFTLCFFPYFVCFMVVAFCEDCVSPELTVAVTWIGYLNSTLNPFLYPLCNAAFKRKFRQMLHLGKDQSKASPYGVRHHTPRPSLIQAD